MAKPKQSDLTRHYWVSGRVQGVSYRASAQQKARELGLVGWVRNCADGRVEVLARGEVGALQSFEHWLWGGPQLAEVGLVEVGDADGDGIDVGDFVIR